MDEKINRIDAVNSLGFHNFHGPESGDFVFPDGETPPTEEVIQAEIVRLQAEYDAQAYARNRQAEYPALTEQLDEIFHNGIDSWKAVIKVTKDKYPK
jgi:hypothetical protein